MILISRPAGLAIAVLQPHGGTAIESKKTPRQTKTHVSAYGVFTISKPVKLHQGLTTTAADRLRLSRLRTIES
jgi:hypothetical protein